MSTESSNSNKKTIEKPHWGSIVLSALSAFIGVQNDKNRERDFQQKSILPFLLVGIVIAATFMMSLFLVAKQIAP